MDNPVNLSDLDKYARERINARKYPDDYHIFKPVRCTTCGVVPLEVTIEHHTGSKKSNFRGVITGLCSKCGKKVQVLKFTGKQRKPLREEKPACTCGGQQFVVAEMERIEREDGMMGFFDEGVVVGKCSECGKNKVFVQTD